MLPTLNRDGFKPPSIWLTASAFGEYRGCERQLVMDAYYRHGGMYSNFHLKFGSAFGAAAAGIAKEWNGSNDSDCYRAAWIGSLAFPVEAEVGYKNFGTLWRAILLWFKHWKVLYHEGWRYSSIEKLTLLRITYADGSGSAVTGGSSDLVIQNYKTGVRKILDFKAVGSNFFGAWEHDPQLIWYMLGDSLSTGHKNYAPPEYWTIVFKQPDADPLLEPFAVHPGSYTNAIVGNLALLHKLCVMPTLQGTLNEVLSRLVVNTHACKTGNFRCFRYAQCYESVPINWAEPREEYATVAAKLTESVSHPDLLDVTEGSLLALCIELEQATMPCAEVSAEGVSAFDEDFDDDLFA